MATETLYPNAAGDLTQFETQFPNSDNHWDKVDEAVADDDTTYISTAFNGRVDLFNLPSMTPLGANNITSIDVYVRAKKTPTGSNVFAYPYIKTGGSVYQGSVSALSTSYATKSATWSTNPQSAVAWTESDINALQIGVISNGGWTIYVTQVYVVITTAPNSPTVTTQACTLVALTTATGNGNITDIGGAAITEHGHCWSTSANPTTADSKTTNGAGSAGAFTSAITGLTAGITYHTRAYATNEGGTSYGDDVEFTTIAGESGGVIAVVQTGFHYVDAYGVERYLIGTIVT